MRRRFGMRRCDTGAFTGANSGTWAKVAQQEAARRLLLLSGMWLDAIVTATDLQNIVDQLTPATIPLGERGHLFFEAPVDVSLVAERGLRVRCNAKVLFPVLGIDVAITIRSMTLMVVPSIESRGGERVIVLAPEVDALDLALLPDIGDAELRAFINRELQAKRIELPWNYKRTLDHQFALPDWFRSSSTFDLRSNGAAVKVTSESIGLAIGFKASVGTGPIAREENASHDEQDAGAMREVAMREGTPNGHGVTVDGRDVRAHERVGAWISPSNGHVQNGVHRGSLVSYQRRRRLYAVGLAVLGGFSLGCLAGLWRGGRA